jgi:hypothetical protein
LSDLSPLQLTLTAATNLRLFCRLIVSSESPLSETHFHSLEIILMQPTRALDTQGDLTSPRGTSNTTSHVIIGGSDNTLAKKVESGY